MKTVAQFDSNGYFVGLTIQYGDYLPNGCIEITPEIEQFNNLVEAYEQAKSVSRDSEETKSLKPNYVLVFNKETNSFLNVPDHRGERYWMPEDEWDSLAKEMKEYGDFPEGATFEPKPKPLSVIEDQVRSQRDSKLTNTDWTQLPDAQATLSQEDKEAYLVYRQALRDITNQPGFPWDGQNIPWPVLAIN